MSVQAAHILQREFHDTSKATASYLLAIGGSKSTSKVFNKELLAGRNVFPPQTVSLKAHMLPLHLVLNTQPARITSVVKARKSQTTTMARLVSIS